MKIKHAVAVAFLENFGFTKAPDWDNEKLVSKLNQVPEKVDGADVPDEFKAVYQELVEAKGQVEISGGASEEEVSEHAEKQTKSKGKKTSAKKETAPAKEKSEKKTKAKGTTTGISMAGRSAFIRKQVEAGKSWDETYEATNAKWPGSSPSNCQKVFRKVKDGAKKKQDKADTKPAKKGAKSEAKA